MLSQGAEEVAVATAGLEDAAGGPEVRHKPPRQLRRRLDVVVADVVAVGLGTHWEGKEEGK